MSGIMPNVIAEVRGQASFWPNAWMKALNFVGISLCKFYHSLGKI